MYISSMQIENYRTFKNIRLEFDSQANYIVGDNNIGKSNFLDLLKSVTHGHGFHETDFMDVEKPIRILCELSTMDMGTRDSIEVELIQSVREVVPRLYNKKNGEQLPLEYMRSIFYIDFSLEELPRQMTSREEVQLLYSYFTDYFREHPEVIDVFHDVLKDRGLPFESNGSPEDTALKILSRIYGMSSDEEETNQDKSSIIQVMMAVGTHLIAVLLQKRQSHAVPFENIILKERDGKTYLPLAISIDDPELYLHPFMQRAVLKLLKGVLNNEDLFFAHLVQSLLGVDGLDGQLFVVTHSTDSLVNNYHQIIRLHWNEKGEVSAACGHSFHFNNEVEKHLIMHFPEVKEAMYAHCAIIVEGETEYGSFPYFAETLGVHLDYYGICLINARGESSISKIRHLLRSFHIPVVCLYDRDVMGQEPESPNVFYTDYICYEMDVVKTCVDQGRADRLLASIKEMSESGTFIPMALIKKSSSKLGVSRKSYPPRKLEHISPRARDALIFYYFSWFYGNKGVTTGRSLGMHLSEKQIPKAFKRVIYKAAELTGMPLERPKSLLDKAKYAEEKKVEHSEEKKEESKAN
jgi:putative ATP-dependent endonuclease of OLD family